jgi:transcriptional antiterminator RfaH
MWYAIYTKPGKEDSVAFRLRSIGIAVLSPKLKSRKFRRGKFTDIIEPLFPCYLFADFDRNVHAHLITYTRGVRYVVGKNTPLPVCDDVIDTIRQGMDEGGIVLVSPGKFTQGDRVIIKDGPFKDFCGVFEREIKGSERVLILLNAIHCRVELDSSYLAVA